MKTIMDMLHGNARVSDYKINLHRKESAELFFVKGKLETVRCTDTCDKEVTVYVRHGEFVGDAKFFVYPSTTGEQLRELIEEAVEKALLICNPAYELPADETGSYQVASNFADFDRMELAMKVGQAVFAANVQENASLNSVEVFINRHTETVCNSRGVDKTQVRYDAMLETIPTYNGENESVELYHQYNFSALDLDAISHEITCKLQEVKARSEAATPETMPACKVILQEQEVANLMRNIAGDLNYAAVYSHSNLFKKGDEIQKDPTGDRIGITMAGSREGCVRSAMFDSDGLSLGSLRIVDQGKAVAYHGSNRFGQYLGETPTGELRCVLADAGSLTGEELEAGPYLKVLSMSGLQVDFFNDYIGGEVRLAYYHDGEVCRPVTGISISGKLSQVLPSIRFSREATLYGSYAGPRYAVLENMTIF